MVIKTLFQRGFKLFFLVLCSAPILSFPGSGSAFASEWGNEVIVLALESSSGSKGGTRLPPDPPPLDSPGQRGLGEPDGASSDLRDAADAINENNEKKKKIRELKKDARENKREERGQLESHQDPGPSFFQESQGIREGEERDSLERETIRKDLNMKKRKTNDSKDRLNSRKKRGRIK